MTTPSPACAKIASFFQSGGVSGEEAQKGGTLLSRSYDLQSGAFISLNCVSKVEAIGLALFQQPANSGLSVATEEDVTKGGMIARALSRLATKITEYEQTIRALGLTDIVSIESAALKNVICNDPDFMTDLQDKTHQTALFVFDIEPTENDIGVNGCKEVRRQNIPPNKIMYVIVPEKYRQEIEGNGTTYGILIDKIRFVEDKEETISISYKDASGNTPSCRMSTPIKVPNYEAALKIVAQQVGNIRAHPLFIHMTRL
jgi:hypothetical protein